MENAIFDVNLQPKDIAKIIVDGTKNSPKIEAMREADAYFSVNNIEISKKRRVYYDKDRKEIENPSANNAKISTTLLRELVEGKQDYCLGKMFVLSMKTNDGKEVKKEDNYYKHWEEFCDNYFYGLCYRLVGEAVNHGLAWVYVWLDESGVLKITDVPSELVYPVWKDRNHTNLDKLVYNYTQCVFNSNSSQFDKEYAEYWTENERFLFDVSGGYDEIKTTETNYHLESADGEVRGWGKIPFVCLKATDDEKTQLSLIKPLVDNFDMLLSRSIDTLVDELDPLLVLKNISPTIDSLIEAREIAKMTKTISVDDDGDAKFITPSVDVRENLNAVETLKKMIISAGKGTDYDDIRFSGNPNEMVIKCLFQKLDTYADGLERHFQDFITNFKYFFDLWLDWKNEISLDESKKYTVYANFDRTMMMNESSKIENVVKVKDCGVSLRTLLENNPFVKDVELELDRLEAEEKKELEKQEKILFNTSEDEHPEEEDFDNK